MPPRVLLVEDDASIRRFVALALEDLQIVPDEATTLAAARASLQATRYALVIADLMLPDGNGMSLLEDLASRADAPARLAFSAGVDRERRARLLELGVREVLDKPVAVGALLDAVSAALDPAAAGPAPPAATDAAPDAVARYFAGDRALFEAYRGQCLAQFATDLAHGDLLAAEPELAGLRRLAHSLKSVLRMLGDDAGSATARTLEDAAARGDAAASAAGWAALRARLLALRGQG